MEYLLPDVKPDKERVMGVCQDALGLINTLMPLQARANHFFFHWQSFDKTSQMVLLVLLRFPYQQITAKVKVTKDE